MEKPVEPVMRNLPPYDWLKEARIYNQNYVKVPNEWFVDSVDIVVVYFSMLNVDRRNIMYEFYEIYENARYNNLPIEVINVPMDDTRKDFYRSFEEQANWFTLRFGDPLILNLQYRYGITAVPHLMVIRTDGTIVSSHGIVDLDEYGMNAIVAWLSTSASTFRPKRLSKELSMYGPKWKYLSIHVGKTEKPDYLRRFSIAPNASTSLGIAEKSGENLSHVNEE